MHKYLCETNVCYPGVLILGVRRVELHHCSEAEWSAKHLSTFTVTESCPEEQHYHTDREPVSHSLAAQSSW